MGLGSTRTYEDLLADGVEAALAAGDDSLEAIARRLNELNVHGPDGRVWTEDLLAAEFRRLGD